MIHYPPFNKAKILLLTILLLLAGCAQAEPSESADDQAAAESEIESDDAADSGEAEPMEAPAMETTREFGDVPAEAYRRAASHLWMSAGGSAVPNWNVNSTHLGRVMTLYRPDITGPAYYEFEVLNEYEPAGFIILSAAEHDFPVVHWNDRGIGPSFLIHEISGSEKVYKLDTLTYATLDGQVQIGPNLLRPLNLDPEWVNITFETTVNDNDELVTTAVNDLTSEPVDAKIPEIEYAAWESWEAMIEGYAEAYAIDLQVLRRDAAQDWLVERDIQKNGHVLALNSELPYYIDLLSPEADLVLSESANEIIDTRLVERGEFSSLLEIIPTAVGEFELSIVFPDREEEIIRFFVTNPDNAESAALPALLQASGVLVGSINIGLSEAPTQWGYYFPGGITYWAGTRDEQSWYYQLDDSSSDCRIGSLTTGWALLYSWTDRRAAYDSTWSAFDGLFREGGSPNGSESATPPIFLEENEVVHEPLREMISNIFENGGGECQPSGEMHSPPKSASWTSKYYFEEYDVPRHKHMKVSYNVFASYSSGMRKKTINHIVDPGAPVLIATGKGILDYTLVWGYHERGKLSFGGLSETQFFYINTSSLCTNQLCAIPSDLGEPFEYWNLYGSNPLDGWVVARTRLSGRIEP